MSSASVYYVLSFSHVSIIYETSVIISFVSMYSRLYLSKVFSFTFGVLVCFSFVVKVVKTRLISKCSTESDYCVRVQIHKSTHSISTR